MTEANLNPPTPLVATPSHSGIPRRYGDFKSFAAALDYAAQGKTGINIYSGRGELEEVLPYRLLREQAIKFAKQLLAKGLKPGDCVAIFADSDGDFARIFFGCQYAGLIPAPLPLPVAFGGKEAYIETVQGMIKSASARAVFIANTIGGWREDILKGVPNLLFGGTPHDFFNVAEDSQTTPYNFSNTPTPDIELPEIDADTLSYLQFSSGSTRSPMGVSVTQKAGLANVSAIAEFGLKVTPSQEGIGDRTVSWLPLYHDMGLVGFFLTPITCQISLDLLPTREFARRPHIWLELISRNKGTLSYSPSFGFDLCAKRGARHELDLSSWRVAGIGGDMIRPQSLESFAEVFSCYGFKKEAFVASYGMAETTLAVSFAPLNKGLEIDEVDLDHIAQNKALPATKETKRTRSFVLCGHALPGHDMEVRDENGNILPERDVGTIFVRGPSLMIGYYNRPEETNAVLCEDGWLNTGDLGYMLRGQVVITGRAKDLIIINGRNIWPQDLEWAAEHHVKSLRARDVAVFSLENENGEEIIALVQCRLSDEENRRHLEEELVSLFRRLHGVEVKVILVPSHSLPQTSSGKLTRAKAKAMLLAGEFEKNKDNS